MNLKISAAILAALAAAVGLLTSASQPNPIEASRLNNLGVAYMNQQLFEKGLNSFHQAAQADPKFVVARLNEGVAYLNLQKIDEAKAALADSGQKDVPVLTIAMDAGFQSLGPFNRAFKADTGLTPSEFRRLALARAQTKPLSEERNFAIGEPR